MATEWTYRDALIYIYSFTDYEKKVPQAYAPEFYDLARVHRLLALLGDPPRTSPVPLLAQIAGITTFEIMTGLALAWFAEQSVEWAVLEVGLGGRLDATNVVTPAIAVITSLSLDHTAILGDSLPEIATEKAGIIKPGVPVVSAP